MSQANAFQFNAILYPRLEDLFGFTASVPLCLINNSSQANQ